MNLLQAVKTRLTEALDGPVVTIVKGIYEELLGECKADRSNIAGDFPALYRNAPRAELYAGCATERVLLGDHRAYRQLERDGVKITPQEFARKVIGALRDLKIAALEEDGFVNPGDSIAISLHATGLSTRAKTCFNTMREIGDRGVRLDAVEWRLLQEVMKSNGGTYRGWTRAAQGVVRAVADLRLQHLVDEF